MQAAQTAGIDLPLKVLAWQSADGKNWLGYNDPIWIGERHGAGANPALDKMAEGLVAMVRQAADDIIKRDAHGTPLLDHLCLDRAADGDVRWCLVAQADGAGNVLTPCPGSQLPRRPCPCRCVFLMSLLYYICMSQTGLFPAAK